MKNYNFNISSITISLSMYEHLFVNHSQRKYVRANDINTNNIEGFWSHFKRVIFSIYHCVSKDYVQRYIDEQVYRWNTRETFGFGRFSDMFNKSVGLIVTWSELKLCKVS